MALFQEIIEWNIITEDENTLPPYNELVYFCTDSGNIFGDFWYDISWEGFCKRVCHGEDDFIKAWSYINGPINKKEE